MSAQASVNAEAGQGLPLKGLRIISCEQYGAGPFGSMYLADLGAEVIKIEAVQGGDVSRQTGPYFLGDNDSEFFQTFNLNKRSLTLDLKLPEGQRVLHRLVASADAVMNNLRGDQPAKLGLDYASLSRHNPRLVCAHLSAYGRHGERATWPGYDYLMQAEAGYLSLTGEPDGPPARFGLSMVDYMTGVTTALGLLAAVFGARQSGIGRDVDVSLFDVAIHQLSYPATWYLNRQHVTRRLERSAHPATVPCQLVRTADGWVFVMCMLDKFWQAYVQGLARAQSKDAPLAWADDPRFVDFPKRRQHRAQLTPLLDAAMSVADTAFWLREFAGVIPIAPVFDLAQALENPWLLTRCMIQELAHQQGENGALRVLANPIMLDQQRLPSQVCAALGADNHALLSALGFSACEIAELEDAGVLRR